MIKKIIDFTQRIKEVGDGDVANPTADAAAVSVATNISLDKERRKT